MHWRNTASWLASEACSATFLDNPGSTDSTTHCRFDTTSSSLHQENVPWTWPQVSLVGQFLNLYSLFPGDSICVKLTKTHVLGTDSGQNFSFCLLFCLVQFSSVFLHRSLPSTGHSQCFTSCDLRQSLRQRAASGLQAPAHLVSLTEASAVNLARLKD